MRPKLSDRGVRVYQATARGASISCTARSDVERDHLLARGWLSRASLFLLIGECAQISLFIKKLPQATRPPRRLPPCDLSTNLLQTKKFFLEEVIGARLDIRSQKKIYPTTICQHTLTNNRKVFFTGQPHPRDRWRLGQRKNRYSPLSHLSMPLKIKNKIQSKKKKLFHLLINSSFFFLGGRGGESIAHPSFTRPCVMQRPPSR
jgi:hypothetical protein